MYNDFFKNRYKKVPIASSHTSSEDTLSHIHSEFEIIYVEKGETDVKIGANTFTASKGDMIFVNPMEVHSLTICTKNDYLHHCICFDTSLICDTSFVNELTEGRAFVCNILKSDHPALPRIKEIFIKLFPAVEKCSDTLPLEACGYISLIFAELINSKSISPIVSVDKKSSFCSKTIKYIKENYGKDISSSHLAKEFYYTQSHFCRTFFSNFGISFSSFLNIYRISKAREMLEDPKAKINEVALKCGFENLSYFSRCFKKQVGISPAEYKKYQYSTKIPSKE